MSNGPDVPDEGLLAKWRNGDERAGNALLERHFDSLCRFFRSKVDMGVDDLIQRTLLRALENADRLRQAASFKSYLFVIARNELVDHFKREARNREAFDPRVSSVIDFGPSPSTALVRDDEETLILKALRRIPLDLQIALELHYWEQMSTRELADTLGVAQGTIKSRLRKAREEVRRVAAEIAEDPARARTTVDNFDDWADRLGRRLRGTDE